MSATTGDRTEDSCRFGLEDLRASDDRVRERIVVTEGRTD